MTTATLTFDVHATVTPEDGCAFEAWATENAACRSILFAYCVGYRLGRCAGLDHAEAVDAVQRCVNGAGVPELHQRRELRLLERELESAGAEPLAVMFGYRVLRFAGISHPAALMNLRLAAEWGLLD